MRVVEMFASIDGEGIFAGRLATFVRFGGCNLRCSYCDTKYAQEFGNKPADEGYDLGMEQIIDYVDSIGYQHVTLTGGEPLIHAGVYDLVQRLADKDYIVNIETNGSIDVSDYLVPNVVVTMDYKLKCSGETTKMNLSNIKKLRPTDVLKFVTDGGYAEEAEIFRVLIMYKPRARVYLSPVFGECSLNSLVRILIDMHNTRGTDKELIDIANRATIQPQLHKIIWGADKRGV